MTISTETNKTGLITYTGAATYSGVITFAYPSAADLKVYVIDASGSGARTLLGGTGGTPDYTVSGTDLIITAAGASTISGLSYTNARLTVYRQIDELLQTSDFSNQGAFLPANIEAAFDFVTYGLQQHEEQLQRCIQIGPWDTTLTTAAGGDDEIRTQAAILPTLTDGGVIYWDSTTKSFEISASVNVDDLATVSGISASITTVATNIVDINTVAGDLEVGGNNYIQTVAGIFGDVTTVAGIFGDVTTVAGISGNVTTVAGIAPDVTDVAGVAPYIPLVLDAVNAADITRHDDAAAVRSYFSVATYGAITGTTPMAIVDGGSGGTSELRIYVWSPLATSADDGITSIIPTNGGEYAALGRFILRNEQYDNLFTIVDSDAVTRKAKFDLSGITAPNTRVLTVPDFDGTIATLAGTETFTNKTLTSPVLNGTLSGDAFLDEDNMASNSATKLASQQSIKAYADGTITMYDSLTALKGAAAPSDGAFKRIADGRLYKWDASSTTSADEPLIVQRTAGGNGRYRLQGDIVPIDAWSVVADAVLSETGVATASDATFTDANAAWTSADVGKSIAIDGAGAAGVTLRTTIASLNSATSVELTVAPSTSVSAARYAYGTNDDTAIGNAITWCETNGYWLDFKGDEGRVVKITSAISETGPGDYLWVNPSFDVTSVAGGTAISINGQALGADNALTANAAGNATSIAVTSSVGTGEIYILSDGKNAVSSGNSGKQSQFIETRSSGASPGITPSIRVRQFSTADSAKIERFYTDTTFKARGTLLLWGSKQTTGGEIGLFLNRLYEPHIDSAEIYGVSVTGIWVECCINPTIDRINAYDAVDTGQGYGVEFSGCWNGYVEYAYGDNTRHVFSTTNSSTNGNICGRGLSIGTVHGDNCRSAAMDWHAGCFNTHVGHVIVNFNPSITDQDAVTIESPRVTIDQITVNGAHSSIVGVNNLGCTDVGDDYVNIGVVHGDANSTNNNYAFRIDNNNSAEITQSETGVATATDATFTDTNASFVAADVGKPIKIIGAGTGGADLETTIASINSGTSIELSVVAATSVNPATYYYGYHKRMLVNIGTFNGSVDFGFTSRPTSGDIFFNIQTASILSRRTAFDMRASANFRSWINVDVLNIYDGSAGASHIFRLDSTDYAGTNGVFMAVNMGYAYKPSASTSFINCINSELVLGAQFKRDISGATFKATSSGGEVYSIDRTVATA